MKKTPVIIVSASLSLVAILVTSYVSRKAIVFADQQTYRHPLTLGHSNRVVAEEWTGSIDEWKRESSLSGVTELGNEYYSNQYGCYVTVYDQKPADMTSDVLFLSGENVSLTLYSVTINYSCTY